MFIPLQILQSYPVRLTETSSSVPELTYAIILAEFTLFMFDGNDIEARATCQSLSSCDGWASFIRNLVMVSLVKKTIDAFDIKSIVKSL